MYKCVNVYTHARTHTRTHAFGASSPLLPPAGTRKPLQMNLLSLLQLNVKFITFTTPNTGNALS